MADREHELIVPPELEAGVYASDLSAWYTQDEFTLDFAAPRGEDEAYLMTARVRIPVTATLAVIDSLNDRVRQYELEFAKIHRPRRRGLE